MALIASQTIQKVVAAWADLLVACGELLGFERKKLLDATGAGSRQPKTEVNARTKLGFPLTTPRSRGLESWSSYRCQAGQIRSRPSI